MFTYGSLFSGIGGIDLGLDRAGMVCQYQVEIDEYAQKVLQKHWPHVTRYGDVRTVGRHNLIPTDLICGGFPCQDISIAGKRVGITGERSGLWKEFYRVICELRPRYVLVENVPALLYWGIDTVLGDLAEAGYDAEWHCLRASDFGAPHIRERIFIVAYPGGTRSPSIRNGLSTRTHDTTGTSGTTLADTQIHFERRLPIGTGETFTRFAINGEDMADTTEQGLSFRRYLGLTTDTTQAGTGMEHEPQRCGKVADSYNQRCQECNVTSISGEQGQHCRHVSTCRQSGQSQSYLGGNIDGVSSWLDGYRWPALPGQEQYEWEPPRVITGRQSNRTHRLKTLGNAVVPQVAEYLGRCILEIDSIQGV